MYSDHPCHKHHSKYLLFVLVNWLVVLGQGGISGPAQAATLNVTNYGARGDVLSLSVNTINNSYVVTATNQLSSADAGKVIEIFGAGTPLTPTNSPQDFAAIIESISDSTNLTLSRPAGYTTNMTPAVYGTYSTTGFQEAIDAAQPGDTIEIPAGRYLVIPPVYDTNWLNNFPEETEGGGASNGAVIISKGAFTMTGDTTADTTILGNGAWQFVQTNVAVFRGTIIYFAGAVTNDGFVLFENLTFDGGVSNGATSYKGWPADNNGDGWDLTHHAISDEGTSPWNTNRAFVNCDFVHWRGEMFIDGIGFPSLPGILNFTNCLFDDGNASGLNVTFGGEITGCTFTNLNLMAELYQGYRLMPLTFEDNTGTDCVDGITIVGAESNQVNQSMFIRSNVFDNTGWAVIFGPAQNLFISNNVMRNLGSAILTSSFAYQSINPIINSNIVIAYNNFTNCAQCFYNGGNGQDELTYMYVSNNVADTISGAFANGIGGPQSNIYFFNNLETNASEGLNSSALSGQDYIDNPSNKFPHWEYNDFVGQTNLISYNYGLRAWINATHAGSVYCLDDTSPTMIPPNVQMVVSNGSGTTLSLYPSATGNPTPITMTNGYSAMFEWTNGAWVNISSATNAPINPVIQVTPGSVAYGTMLTGTSKTNSFTVANMGGGTLSGTASVVAPFSILSGGSYSLGSNQSQTVTVEFSPTVASNYTQSVTFTGGGGTNATVTGSATNAPSILPAVSAISVNATAVDTNAPGLQIYPGTIVQLSATATNALTWQWSYTVNGGSPVVYTNSTSPVTNISLCFDTNAVGNSYIWTLVVSNGQAWAESQTNFGVEDITQGPTFTATSGTWSGFLTAQSVINGILSTYIYQSLPSIGSTSGGTAVYDFTITNAGNYEVQALVNAPNLNANSFYVNIDGQPQNPTMIWDIMPVTSGFQQRMVSWRGNGSENNDQIVPKIFNLGAGPHQIIFVGREPGTALAGFTLLQLVPLAEPPPPPATPNGLRIISSSP